MSLRRSGPKRALLALACLVAAVQGQAEGLQDLAGIRALAEHFVRTQLSSQSSRDTLYVEAGELDPRLRLPFCPAPTAFLPQGASIGQRTTIGVRCQQPLWSIYLPVNVESEFKVLVLKQAAARGSSLSVSDVELQSRRVPGFSGAYLVDPQSLAGRHLRADAAPGTALTVELLIPDVLIHRGQRVTLLASTGGIDVRAQGEAVSDANSAGRVRVENLSSHKIIEGQVESTDLVRVGP